MDSENPWDEDDGTELEAEIMRADHPFAADLQGTTAEEALAGEGLDAALARERPEGRTTDEALSVLDDDDPDVEGELVAEGSIESDEYAATVSDVCRLFAKCRLPPGLFRTGIVQCVSQHYQLHENSPL